MRGIKACDVVSIHAPVKGRLYETSERFTLEIVSIHAPVKGRPQAKEFLP